MIKLIGNPENCISKAKITAPEEIVQILRKKITKDNQYKEHFLVCSLTVRNTVIAVNVVSIGTLTSSIVHPREVFEVAIKKHAAHIIIAHNHPGGETDPSEDDLKITKRLADVGKIMGIEVLDHIIFTQKEHYSFKENNIL